jgi:hypothetical protein
VVVVVLVVVQQRDEAEALGMQLCTGRRRRTARRGAQAATGFILTAWGLDSRLTCGLGGWMVGRLEESLLYCVDF